MAFLYFYLQKNEKIQPQKRMIPAPLHWYDISLLIIYSFIILTSAYFASKNIININNTFNHKVFVIGLAIKLLGGFLFAIIHNYYYHGGDTFAYYNNISTIYNIFNEQPTQAFKIVFDNYHELPLNAYLKVRDIHMLQADNSFMVIKIGFLCSLLCFNNFWLITLLFSVISFIGTWAMYRIFYTLYPNLKKQIAASLFFLPSIFFWSAGLLKDPIAFSSLGLLLYSLYYAFIQKKQIWLHLFIIFATMYIINTVKGYILAAFIPPAMYWVFMHYFKRISDIRLKFVTLTVAFICTATFITLQANTLIALQQAFIQKFIDMAIGFQSWHTFLAETRGQSGYSLGTIDFTPIGVLSKMPAAINVALFRPYPHEARSAIILLSALESSSFLIFTLYVILKKGFFNTLSIILSNPFVFFCLFFALFFAFAVGFTSYNFGALVRYKIPCLPFYLIGFFIILHTKSPKTV